MKRTAITLAGVLVLLTVLSAALAAQGRGRDNQQTRTVTGQVLDRNDHPLPDAVVYLQNSKTMTVKTFITDAQGNFRFHALSPNADYQIYAEYKGQKSETKTLSSFDSRPNVTIYLHIK